MLHSASIASPHCWCFLSASAAISFCLGKQGNTGLSLPTRWITLCSEKQTHQSWAVLKKVYINKKYSKLEYNCSSLLHIMYCTYSCCHTERLKNWYYYCYRYYLLVYCTDLIQSCSSGLYMMMIYDAELHIWNGLYESELEWSPPIYYTHYMWFISTLKTSWQKNNDRHYQNTSYSF